MLENFAIFVCYAQNLGIRRAARIAAWKSALILSRPIRDSDFIYLDRLKVFLIPRDQGLSKELRRFKTHEPLATSIFMRELKEGMNIVDIGSNVGYYALQAAKKVGSRGKVLAVEPNPPCFRFLERNVISNRLSNMELKQTALWSEETTIWFEVVPAMNLSRGIGTEANLHGKTRENLIQVQATTLDTLLSDWDRVDWLRFDVEGNEYQIMEGATETIRNFSPNIFMELHPGLLGVEKASALLRGLEDYGYEIKYAVIRAVDRSLVANKKTDIKRLKIRQLSQELTMPAYLLWLKKHVN